MAEQNPVIKQNPVDASESAIRFETLDGFRGIAALWIVIFHLLLTGTNVGEYGLGTVAFLVISGFAILHSVSRVTWETSSAISFVKRRLSRIYGPYLFCLLFAGFVVPIACALIEVLKGRPSPVKFFPYTFMDWVQVASLVKVFSAKSWGLGLPFSPLWINWYLAIIVQIYLIVAVAILARSRKLLLCVTSLSVLVLLPSVKELFPYGLFLPYWFPFSVGMALSYVTRKGYVLRLDWQRDHAWYVAGICAYSAGVSFLLWLFYAPYLFALAVAFLLWLVYPIDGRVANWLPWRVFRVIGLMSYSLYLVHVPVSHLAMKFIPNGSRLPTQISQPFLWVPLTVFMSYLWSAFFERPGSIHGYVAAVTRPLRTLKAALREDWQIVFPSRTPNPLPNAYQRSSLPRLLGKALSAVAAKVLGIPHI